MRLTALLLGELPAEEAEALKAELAGNPELAAQYQRLKAAADLAREVVHSSRPAEVDSLRLSPERRAVLRARFQRPAVQVVPMPQAPRRSRPAQYDDWIGLAASVVALLGLGTVLLLAFAPPLLRRSYSHTSASAGPGDRGETPGADWFARGYASVTSSPAAKPPASSPGSVPGQTAYYFESARDQGAAESPSTTPASAAQNAPAAPALGYFEDRVNGRGAGPGEGGGGLATGDRLGSSPARTKLLAVQQGAKAVDNSATPTLDSVASQILVRPTVVPAKPKALALAVPIEGPVEERSVAQRPDDERGTAGQSEARVTLEKSESPPPPPAPAARHLLRQAEGKTLAGQVDAKEKLRSEVLAEVVAGQELQELFADDFAAGRPVVTGTRLPTERDRFRKELSPARDSVGLELRDLPALEAYDLVPRQLGQKKFAEDPVLALPAAPALVPEPEVVTAESPFSTFSLNVTDVSFKLAAASLERGTMPDRATLRSEEFVNAFDYRDPEPAAGVPVGFTWERARHPFAHDRDLVRFAVKAAASGRGAGRALNLVLLLDNSGSMERADRVRIREECLRVLAGQLQPDDTVSVVAFARTARLWVDGMSGRDAAQLPVRVGELTPDGGTNLEEALRLAYQTAARHFRAGGLNRVVLLTDGAANLGDVDPASLTRQVEAGRRQGIALDCFGIGWEGLNDPLLEALSRRGDGRYGFLNSPGDARHEFAAQLTGALQVAAADVKVQVEWNPRRVTMHRLVGYTTHRLTKEQFRDNTVDAAEIAAAEAGNALYVVQVNPAGEGPLGTVRVRFRVPSTGEHREHAWPLDYGGQARPMDQAAPSLRLAAVAATFGEWLAASPHAAEVTTDRLARLLQGVPAAFAPDPKPRQLEQMIRQAGAITGK